MGVVFSCLGSTVLLIGEMVSTLVLSIGEIGSLVVRGIFGLMTGLCDVLAACMCCCRVPFSERPSRDGYTYATIRTPAAMSKYNATPVIEASDEQSAVKDKRHARVVDGEKFSKTTFKAPVQYFVKPQVTFHPASLTKTQNKEAAGEDGEKKDGDAEAATSSNNILNGFSAAFKRTANGKAPEAEKEDDKPAEDEKAATAPKRSFFSKTSKKKPEAETPSEDKTADGEAEDKEASAKKRSGMFSGFFGRTAAAPEDEKKKEEEAKKDE